MSRSCKPVQVVVVLVLTAALGCSNAKQGAVSGAGIGALSGLAIGSLTGSAGKGAAIGAVVGGVGGAVVGDQNRRKSEQAAAAAQANSAESNVSVQPVAPVADTSTYQTGTALGRLVGNWKIAGTMQLPDGKSLPVTGDANAVADQNYFIHMDVHFTDPRDGQKVDGTCVINQRGGRAIEMTNSFSSSPQVKRFSGEVDQTGTVFNFTQTDPPGWSRKLIIRASNGAQWTADVWEGNQRVESYTFSR